MKDENKKKKLRSNVQQTRGNLKYESEKKKKIAQFVPMDHFVSLNA